MFYIKPQLETRDFKLLNGLKVLLVLHQTTTASEMAETVTALKVLLVLHQTTTSVDLALILQGFRRVFQLEKHLAEAEEVV